VRSDSCTYLEQDSETGNQLMMQTADAAAMIRKGAWVEQPQEASQEQAEGALRQATQAGLEAELLATQPYSVQWFLDTNNGLISRLAK